MKHIYLYFRTQVNRNHSTNSTVAQFHACADIQILITKYTVCIMRTHERIKYAGSSRQIVKQTTFTLQKCTMK